MGTSENVSRAGPERVGISAWAASFCFASRAELVVAKYLHVASYAACAATYGGLAQVVLIGLAGHR